MHEGKITKIMEKPKDPPTNFAVTGIYFLTPKIFDIIDNLKPSWRNELEITDALQILLSENNKISYNIITDYWKDTGTPEDIINANKAILENKESYFYGEKSNSVSLTGIVLIEKGTKILGNSQIIGPVIIGKNCILDNVCIGSIVMSNCIINTPIKIRNSIISSNSEIEFKNESQDEKIFLLGEGTKIHL